MKTLIAARIVGESVKSGRRFKKWSNIVYTQPISKVVKCCQNLMDRSFFSFCAPHTANNTTPVSDYCTASSKNGVNTRAAREEIWATY